MRDTFRKCPVNIYQKSKNNRRIPLSKNKRECVALRSLPKQNWRKSQSILYQEILHNVGFAKVFYYFLGMFCCFLGSMRCKSGSAKKKSNITFHMSSLLIISSSSFNLNYTKNILKFIIRNQKHFLGNYFRHIWNTLHSSRIKMGNC